MKILFPTTRDLCYFSADFFAEQMKAALERQGHEVVRLPLPETIVDGKPVTRDFSPLEKYEGQHFDAIIDINSKLPYLESEPGVRYLDTFDAPFINILLDHPLYHHPGLVFPLKRYYAVCIDRSHQAYIDRYYPGIRKCFFLPLAGTVAAEARQAERDADDSAAAGGKAAGRAEAAKTNRIPRLLFPGTYEPESVLLKEAEALPGWAGRIVKDLYGGWNPEEEPMEDAVRHYLEKQPAAQKDAVFSWLKTHEKAAEELRAEAADSAPVLSRALFPVVMNYLYPLDRLTRFAMRKRVITALAEAGTALDIQGEGWGTTGIFDRPNVQEVAPMPIGDSIELMARYRAVLDINPNFFEGLHDRVSTALVNGCRTFSNMSQETAPETPLFLHYSSFDTEALCDAVRQAMAENFAAEGGEAGRRSLAPDASGDAGKGAYPLAWNEYAEQLTNIIHICNA